MIEYLTRQYSGDITDLEAWLNKYGAQGWQLVTKVGEDQAVARGGQKVYYIGFVFMRPTNANLAADDGREGDNVRNARRAAPYEKGA